MDEPQNGQNWNSAGLSRPQFGHVATPWSLRVALAGGKETWARAEATSRSGRPTGMSMATAARADYHEAESIRLLVSGERGPGSFPAPVSRLKLRNRLWLWSDVARWARDSLGVEVEEPESSTFISALNDAFELARLMPALSDPTERKAIVDILRPVRQGHTSVRRALAALDELFGSNTVDDAASAVRDGRDQRMG
jgi:hypothetical protein